MSIGKTCGMAVIIVVITPVLLGMVWPTGTETVDVWDVEPAMDLTTELDNREIRVYDTYSGPLNNLTLIGTGIGYPTPADTTEVPNPYPYVAAETPTTETSVTIGDLATSGKSRIVIDGTAMEYSGSSEEWTHADYIPNLNVLTLYSASDSARFTPTASQTISTSFGSMTVTSYGAATEWMDPDSGLIVPSADRTWTNGMTNKSLTMWLRFLHAPMATSVTIDGALVLDRSTNGTLTATLGDETKTIGSTYSFIEVTLDQTGVTVTGLLGVDDFSDATWSRGNSVSFSMPDAGTFHGISLHGSYARFWVKSTVSDIGSTRGMSDVSVVPDSYYPSHAWQLQLLNPSTFGTSLGIGSLTLPVSSGNVTVTSLDDGEQYDQPIRGMRILSLVLNGQQQIYVNGVKVLEQSPAAVTVSLNGDWYMSVVLSKVTQGTAENFTWSIGSFGFDQAAFCLAGLMSCVAVAIGGTIWGRRSGERVLALQLTMALAGAAFLVMM